MKKINLIIIASVFILTACGSPQLKEYADGEIKWDNSFYFNSVPKEQLARGENICSRIGMEAVGYHDKARDLEGNIFQGGGFHCKETEKSKAMAQQDNDLTNVQAVLANGGDLSLDMAPTAAGQDGYTVSNGVVYELK